jgi:hypothetical protein
MKKIILLLLLFWSLVSLAQQQNVTSTISPNPFEETTSITITIAGSSVNEGTWGVTGNALYMWTWSFDINDANSLDCPTNGFWNASNEENRFIYNSTSDTYTKTFTPNTFYNRNGIGRIGFLVKAKDGSGDKKSQDNYVDVGVYQVTLNSPAENSSTIISSGGSLNIAATNTGGNASYVLKANGTTLNTNAATSSYSYNHTNITGNQNYELQVTQGTTVITKKISAIVNPNVVSEAMPTGLLDGINYNAADVTKATLVLDGSLQLLMR